VSILRAIQRAILKPRFTLNRNERRSLERGKRILVCCKRGDDYVLSLERGLELNEKNIKTKYLKPTRR
jgi:hypothetical protein